MFCLFGWLDGWLELEWHGACIQYDVMYTDSRTDSGAVRFKAMVLLIMTARQGLLKGMAADDVYADDDDDDDVAGWLIRG